MRPGVHLCKQRSQVGRELGIRTGWGGSCSDDGLDWASSASTGRPCSAPAAFPDNLIGAQVVGGPVSQALLSWTGRLHPPCPGGGGAAGRQHQCFGHSRPPPGCQETLCARPHDPHMFQALEASLCCCLSVPCLVFRGPQVTNAPGGVWQLLGRSLLSPAQGL